MRLFVPKISGQWLGHFKYGPEYGDLYGEMVSFSLVLEDIKDNVFEGKCYELEGFGVSPDAAIINGYVDGDFIHFVKEYPVDYQIEEDKSIQKLKLPVKPILTYDGQYNHTYGCYQGNWEIEVNLGPTINGDLLDICTGTWEMSKCTSI